MKILIDLLVFIFGAVLCTDGAQLFIDKNGPAILKSAIDIREGFSFKFRTCTAGTLLYQGNETSFFQVTLTSTSFAAFSRLTFSWKAGHYNGKVKLEGYFSFDRNVLLVIELLKTNKQKYIFRVDGVISMNRTIENATSLMNMTNSGPLQLGSDGFVGCIQDGKGVNVSTAFNGSIYKRNCPLDDVYRCHGPVCPGGFTGRFCSHNIDECGSYPCHSYATCVDGINNYKCVCGPRWTGPTCSDFLGSLCNSTVCQNGGLCMESLDRNNYSCVCPKGYTGRNCENIFHPCSAKPCRNGGSCYNWTTPNSLFEYNCTCKDGFKGVHCEFNSNECFRFPCRNGACIDGINSYSCICNGSGFTGKHCETDINECSTIMPCKNNGTCINSYGGYKCSCHEGYSGLTCEEDVDECKQQPCTNNGTCINTYGSYKCNCVLGYTGQNCNSNINECTPEICKNGTCIDQLNNYSCACLPGYTGRNCEIDIKECGSDPCLNNGTCIEQANSYKCSCLGAFNGTNCEIWTDPCLKKPCLNNGTCKYKNNTETGFECSCNGTRYAGPLCQFIPGVCYPNNPCINGRCHDYGSFYNCTCNTGFMGFNCSEDIDECLSSPCQFSGRCTNTPGSYKCTCTPYSTGRNCEMDIYKCSPRCQNGGACFNRTAIKDICLCAPPWHGDACERRIDYCSQDKPYCGNGKCQNLYSESKNEAICVCNDGYTGNNCTIDVDECQLGYCQNNISCNNDLGNYSCGCMVGFSGRNCTENIKECASNPCLNNGTCHDEINGYRCICKVGFNGSHCENDVNWCFSSPCQNEGNCTDGTESYSCTCHKGYRGHNCEIDVNECESNPCQYGGICIQRSNVTAVSQAFGKNDSSRVNDYTTRHGYICICYPGTTGVNCATNINECNANPCQNNATCTDLLNGYNCSCLPGFTGQNCTLPTTIAFNGTGQWNLSSTSLDVEFNFKTTLKTGLILQIAASNGNLFLALGSQGLILLDDSGVSQLNITSVVTDGEWHRIFVILNENSTNITIDGKTYHQSIALSNITKYYAGSVHNAPERIKRYVPGYIGCIRDLKIGGVFKVPTRDGSLVRGDVGSCVWKRLCSHSPCQNAGNCSDLWSSFKCACQTGYFGETCAFASCAVKNPCHQNVTCFDLKSGNTTCIWPYTFNGTDSYAVYNNTKLSNYTSLQFSIRTRNENGLILSSSSNSSHFMTIALKGGAIEVVYRYWYMSDIGRLNGVTKVNDGNWQSIRIRTAASTSIVVDSKTDASNDASILSSPFRASLDQGGITVGRTSNQFLAALFNHTFFKGCFKRLLIGDDLLQHKVSEGLRLNCHGDKVCRSKPCVRGTCVDIFDSYRCDCPQFYSGINCNLTHNVSCGFTPDLCHPSATCRNLSTPAERKYSQTGKDYFRCDCAAGYSGYLCTTVNNCSPDPCVNGTCTSQNGNYTCNCYSGFSGRNCTVDVDECSSNPCKNGGRCQDKVNGYVCQCSSGYEGNACQNSVTKTDVGMWVGIAIAILVVVLVILFIIFRNCECRGGQSGGYSPSGQEKGQVQMTSMPPIPPKERLI